MITGTDLTVQACFSIITVALMCNYQYGPLKDRERLDVKSCH